jgi:phage terminase large subunit-like protein
VSSRIIFIFPIKLIITRAPVARQQKEFFCGKTDSAPFAADFRRGARYDFERNRNMNEKELIYRIRKIEQLLDAREATDALGRYNKGEKVHEKQMAFHRSLKRNRWVFGGNRSGKTECGAVEAVWMARGIHPYRQNRSDVFGWVVSVSREVQRDVAQSKILHYLNPDWIEDVIMCSGQKGSPSTGVIDTIIIRNAFGGLSKIGFKSADQGREKFQGASLDFVWFDEEPPRDIYEECKMRVLDRKGDLFGTMTPLKGLTWVYDEIYLNKYADDEVFYIQMEWGDNPFLDKSEIEALTKSMSPETLDSRRYGNFRSCGGLVYPEFDQNIHVVEPFDIPYEWQDVISIDPGLRNPLSAHFYCEDNDGNIYVAAEHYDREKDVCYHAEKIKEIADRLGWHRDRNGNLEALMDSAAEQRTLASKKSVAELFREQGIDADCRVNKDMFSGVNRVKNLFAARPPKIFIFKNCVNMIREIKGYFWGDSDLPVKKDDHAMDEFRYYVMSKAAAAPKKAEVGLLEKNYRKLYSEAKRGRA